MSKPPLFKVSTPGDVRVTVVAAAGAAMLREFRLVAAVTAAVGVAAIFTFCVELPVVMSVSEV
jgi:hypothetical protein